MSTDSIRAQLGDSGYGGAIQDNLEMLRAILSDEAQCRRFLEQSM